MKHRLCRFPMLLALSVVTAMMPSLPAAAAEGNSSFKFRGTPADRKALAGYRLDSARVERFITVMQAIEAEAKSDPALAKELKTFAPVNVTGPIQEQIDSFPKAFPRISSQLQQQKYSARDWILTPISLGMAGMALTFNSTDQLPDWVPAENVRMLKANAERLRPILAPR